MIIMLKKVSTAVNIEIQAIIADSLSVARTTAIRL